MSARLSVEADGASRPVEAPVAIGGPGAAIAADAAAGPLAHIGLDGGELFLQPRDGVPVRVNGVALTSSRWLADGDAVAVGDVRVVVHSRAGQVRLEVASEAGSDETEPPELGPEPDEIDGAASTIRPVAFAPRRLRPDRRPRRRRVVTALAWLLLVLPAAATWFLVTARSVELAIEPHPDASALAGNPLRFELGGRHLLRPGRYTVTAEKEGYHPLAVELEVTPQARQSFRFTLRKLPGRLEVAVTPGDVAARVIVDGDDRGTTPLAALPLEPGEHEVRVRAPGHVEFAATVAIEGMGRTQQLRAVLTRDGADVTFTTAPAGATVTIDGRELGVTPLVEFLGSGGHDVRYSLLGYQAVADRFAVVADEPVALPLVRLRPAPARVDVRGQPSGATVTVDGVYAGEAPLTTAVAAGDAHTLKIAAPGYQAKTVVVDVPAGETRSVRYELAPLLGEVELVVSPAGADVTVDGAPFGKAGPVLHLSAVEHTVVVSKDGFAPFTTTITPRPGFRQTVRATLQSLGRAEPAAAAERYRSDGGQEMLLVAGGRLRMGASRREPGRRSNEVRRDVVLNRRFYLSTTEVSNRQFRRFRPEHRSGRAQSKTLDLGDQPVVRVTWEDAVAYCNWLSERESLPVAYVRAGESWAAVSPMTTGYRLPTEAEWAWAAAYAGGRAAPVKYPWGAALPVAGRSGNFADEAARELLPLVIDHYQDGHAASAPVGSFAANPLGLFDLGGNVAEWVHDRYAIRPPGSGGVERDPTGPADGRFHVIRGSSWMHATVTELRFSYRDYGNKPRADVGFRVARYVE